MFEEVHSLFNVDKLCRTCLLEGEMQDLFVNNSSTAEEKCILEMLTACTVVEFVKKDGFPSQICSKCVTEIKIAYDFSKKCEKSNQLLEEYFKNCKNNVVGTDEIKTEDIKCEEARENKILHEDTNCGLTDQTDNIDDIHESFDIDSEDNDEIKNESKNDQQVIISDENVTSKIVKKSITNRVKKKYQNQKLKRSPPYECKICLVTYGTFKELVEHRRNIDHPNLKNTTVRCTICNKSVLYKSLRMHIKTHSLEKSYCCEQCGERYSNKWNLKRHVSTKHSNERPFKCEVCDKGFKKKEIFKEHLRIHSGEKPFVCNVCGKSFTHMNSLRVHVLRHEGKYNGSNSKKNPNSINEEHPCNICNKVFKGKANLYQHKMLSHGEKKFLCNYCGKGFVKLHNLQSHLSTHTGVKQFICKLCKKAFSHSAALYSHVRTHTGERPYICKVCGKSFTQWSHLKSHKLTHTGEKPYVCSVCGKCFAQNGNLTVHVRTHTGETPYVCPVCGKGFYDSSSMKKHKKGHGTVQEGRADQ